MTKSNKFNADDIPSYVSSRLNVITETVRKLSLPNMIKAMTEKDIYDLLQIDIGFPELFKKYSNDGDLEKAIENEGSKFQTKSFRFARRLLFFAYNDEPLLIVGETGTSKQLIAEAIHKVGSRSGKPFKEINCTAYPETMFDAMLSGWIKGVFTGAERDNKGLLEEADGGVLFLDEIAKVPINLQAKLLKVIETKKYNKLGKFGDGDKLNIKFMAAVHPNDLSDDKLLPDLKFRFGFPCCIYLPNLRERINDGGFRIIELCLDNVLNKMDIDKSLITMNSSCYDLFSNRDYKGNYRELEGILKSAIINVCIDERYEIMPSDLQFDTAGVDRNNDTHIANQYSANINSIKLSEIIEYSEKIQKQIVTEKVERIYTEGGKPLAVLQREGMTKEDAGNYSNKLKNIVGPLRDIKKLSK